jgi:solute carrier family 35 protein E3
MTESSGGASLNSSDTAKPLAIRIAKPLLTRNASNGAISSNDDPNSIRSYVTIGAGLLINLVSCVAIIQINKYIYSEYYFSNMCLTCIHFLVTFVCLLTLNQLGVCPVVRVSLRKMLPMSVSFCGYILLTNYSLQFNSIGTYQCLKALSTPGVMLISIYYYKHEYSRKVKLTVLPVLIGVLFNSVYDLNFNLFGQFIGLLGVVVSSLYLVV